MNKILSHRFKLTKMFLSLALVAQPLALSSAMAQADQTTQAHQIQQAQQTHQEFKAPEIELTESRHRENQVVIHLPTTTQGPLWPPSAISDSNGDFIVVGSSLEKNSAGEVTLVPGRSLIVSKNTVPPLDENGRENFINPFGAAYKQVRELDLSKGSEDLKMVLHAHSYGPPEGDFGGGPRVPALGVSDYNLNSFPLNGQPCPEIFPSESQRNTYMRPGFALHKVPISGFQGDHMSYNVSTGETFLPYKKTEVSCPTGGCAGENMVDTRRTKPITLGEWLKAKVKVKIRLTDYNRELQAYTAARFTVVGRNLLPNSFYHVFSLRANLFRDHPVASVADPLGMPSLMVTDEKGYGRLSVKVENPFPASQTDEAGLRIMGISVAFRSGFQNNGACVTAYGPGVDVHAVANSFGDGRPELTHFTTKAAPAQVAQ